jgi:hypothetical protein
VKINKLFKMAGFRSGTLLKHQYIGRRREKGTPFRDNLKSKRPDMAVN